MFNADVVLLLVPSTRDEDDRDDDDDDEAACTGESGAIDSDDGETLLGEDDDKGGVEREQSLLLTDCATLTYNSLDPVLEEAAAEAETVDGVAVILMLFCIFKFPIKFSRLALGLRFDLTGVVVVDEE